MSEMTDCERTVPHISFFFGECEVHLIPYAPNVNLIGAESFGTLRELTL